MLSTAVAGAAQIPFPGFNGDKIYMQPFTIESGLPHHLKKWEPTVKAMLEGVETKGKIYLMVDQQYVKPGQVHRRGGAHVDNYWIDDGHQRHGRIDPKISQGLILSSNIEGCVGYMGQYHGYIGDGGEIPSEGANCLMRIPFKANRAYAGDTSAMIHESVPVTVHGCRTVVRLNVDGWTPFSK